MLEQSLLKIFSSVFWILKFVLVFHLKNYGNEEGSELLF